MTEINNSDDIIDSRDVEERISKLETEFESAYEEYKEALDQSEAKDFEDWLDNGENDEYAVEELKTLRKLSKEGNDYCSDWIDGATLIRESYFEDYCQEEIEDCGYISKDFPWWIEIDWAATAKNMREDYTELDFDGVTYYIRSC